MAKLHIGRKPDKEEINAESEQKIQEYIENNEQGYFEDVLEHEDCINVFFELSELRKGLLNWYDFKPEAEILEVEAGFGALTGLLCEKAHHVIATETSLFRAQNLQKRYENVLNLDIYVDDVVNIIFTQKFDYIILTGVLERFNGNSTLNSYIDYLRRLSTLLKEDGKLLISVDNKYGLKYFCGARDLYTKIPFGGFSGNRNDVKGRLFSRQELIEIIKEAGLTQYKFYYPLPDYKMPQIVYSENHLPENNVKERLIPYYDDNSTLLMDERLLYDDIVQNNAFEFLANSFFVECGTGGNSCSIDYAAVSIDRGKERSFATKIYSEGKVIKAPLYKEGNDCAEDIINNLKNLRERGIPVVNTDKTTENEIIMPYICADTLSNYLKKLVRSNQTAFLEAFDILYDYILQSSDQCDKDKNIFLQRDESVTDLPWGPILKNAYIELIPLNCFYLMEEQDDKKEMRIEKSRFLYFDQEFVFEYYPAKYILYRAIKYVYCFTSDAEKYVPIEVVKERFGLEKIWSYFHEEEERFLDKVRNRQKYAQFYQKAGVNYANIQANRSKIGTGIKKGTDYVVTDKMKKIWQVELDLLAQLDRVCKKYGLQYFMIHGTLLGAVRHRGFIPWDDDLDVVMPRKDYERLKEIGEQEFVHPYFLQTPENDPQTYNNGHIRLRNSNTTGMETKDIGHDCNLGIWIDILVLDDGVVDERKRKKKLKRIYRTQYLLKAKTYGADTTWFGNMGEKKWRRYVFESRFYSRKKLCDKLKKEQMRYNDTESRDVVIYGDGRYQPFSRKDFENAVLLDFEGQKYPAPVGYRHWLEVIMGRDYMKYPPIEKRKPGHEGIFDTEKTYKEYNKYFAGLFQGAEGKKLVLFGAGLMFEHFMSHYGGRYRPDFIVDNDEQKWETEKAGIPIKNPKILKTIPADEMHLIICSFYYKEIENQLETMGVNDYRIYIQNASWITEAER